MRLADDRRGRVPFALLGVLLLVSSAAFATTLSTRGPIRRDEHVDAALDRVEAAAHPAVRSGVKAAARDAAQHPVTSAANTTAGRALNASAPFRSALKVRIYLAVRDRFNRTTAVRDGDVVARASLPAVESASDLVAVRRRVELQRAGNGTAVRVTLRNVTLTARRGGRAVLRERENLTLTVETPVLAVHERVEAYERRLNRGPLEGSGLGRRVTARLYPIVWARGYAQYGGAPVENVLANRHVELTTNGGVLGTQRAVFGHEDPVARRGFRYATAYVGMQDAWAGLNVEKGCVTNVVTPPSPVRVLGQGAPPRYATSGPDPERTMTVGINESADVAFAALLTDAGDDGFPHLLRGSYRTEARVVTRVRHVRDGDEPARESPGENWSLVSHRQRSRTHVDRGPAAVPDPDGWRRFTAERRHVTRHYSLTRIWRKGNHTVRREFEWTDRYRVGIAVVGRYAPDDAAPDGSVRSRFARGGALDGPNLADVPDRAADRAVDSADAIAVRAVEGDRRETGAAVYGRRPVALANWTYRDVASLRERVRNVSVSVPAASLATGDANPPASLAAKLRERRAALVDAPETYDGVADRARVSARAAYLDRVIAVLDERADAMRSANGGFENALSDAGVESSARLGKILAVRRQAGRSEDRAVAGGGLGGNVTLVPDGSPGYLTTTGVTTEHVTAVPQGETYHPLVARNVNVFSVPYGNAANGVVDVLFGSKRRVSLGTAGRTLVAANRSLGGSAVDVPNRGSGNVTNGATLARRRDALRRSVADSLDAVDRRTRRVLRRRTTLSGGARRAVVRSTWRRWNGTGERALAVANGSFARAVTTELERRDGSFGRADRAGVRLRVAVADAVRSKRVRVPQQRANRTATAVREYSHSAAHRYVSERFKRATEREMENVAERLAEDSTASVTREATDEVAEEAVEEAAAETAEEAAEETTERASADAFESYSESRFNRIPAGLPVLPAPGYWYATVNLWTVRVRGSYLRFTVRAYSGAPGGGGATLQYVREESAVALDVDDDGDAERLGRTDPLTFETSTAVAVAVPPNGGVGDRDGMWNESTEGWPSPGCEGNRSCRAR